MSSVTEQLQCLRLCRKSILSQINQRLKIPQALNSTSPKASQRTKKTKISASGKGIGLAVETYIILRPPVVTAAMLMEGAIAMPGSQEILLDHH